MNAIYALYTTSISYEPVPSREYHYASMHLLVIPEYNLNTGPICHLSRHGYSEMLKILLVPPLDARARHFLKFGQSPAAITQIDFL